MGGWEKFKILVKKKKEERDKDVEWGDKSINQMVERKGRKNKRNRKRKNGLYLRNLKRVTFTRFLQQNISG